MRWLIGECYAAGAMRVPCGGCYASRKGEDIKIRHHAAPSPFPRSPLQPESVCGASHRSGTYDARMDSFRPRRNSGRSTPQVIVLRACVRVCGLRA
eukprot:gene12072-biopygen7262